MEYIVDEATLMVWQNEQNEKYGHVDGLIKWLNSQRTKMVWNDYETYGVKKLGRYFSYNEEGFDYFDGKTLSPIRFFIPTWEEDGVTGTGYRQKDKHYRKRSIYYQLLKYRYLNGNNPGFMETLAVLLDGRKDTDPIDEVELKKTIQKVLWIPREELRLTRSEERRSRIDPSLNRDQRYKAMASARSYILRMDKQADGVLDIILETVKGWKHCEDGLLTYNSIASKCKLPLSTVKIFDKSIDKEIRKADLVANDEEIRKIDELGVSVSAQGVVFSRYGKPYTLGKQDKKIRISVNGESKRYSIRELMEMAGFPSKYIENACGIQ